MFRRMAFWRRRRLEEAGERARRVHSVWLTRALVTDAHLRAPRIPTRPVRDGGFTGLMSTEGGRTLARRWWGAAFREVDDL